MNNNLGLLLDVADLGIATYLKMQGFAVSRKKERNVIQFKVPAERVKDFHAAKVDYVNSICSQFDHELMNLKKLDMEHRPEDRPEFFEVKDLGVAAFLKINGFNVAYRKERNVIVFTVAPHEESDFERLKVEYLSHSVCEFDHHLMGIKKLEPARA